jgi:hypothetical protein
MLAMSVGNARRMAAASPFIWDDAILAATCSAMAAFPTPKERLAFRRQRKGTGFKEGGTP